MIKFLAEIPDVLPEGFFAQVWFFFRYYWKTFLGGIGITLLLSILGTIFGFGLGLGIAYLRKMEEDKTDTKLVKVFKKIGRGFASGYIEFFRGTPMMVQLLIMGFVIMVPKSDAGMIVCGIVTLGINSGAYVAEIARSGLMSISIGQTEAGRSLGLSYGQTMWHIVIPQAIKNILPALGNEMITLLKDTSLVSVIALRDVTKQAQNIVSKTYQAYIPYISLALIYLVIVIVLTKLLGILERRLRKSDH